MAKNIVVSVDEFDLMTFEEILAKFEITDEQAEDSECGGESEAEDGFPLKRSSRTNIVSPPSEKKRKKEPDEDEIHLEGLPPAEAIPGPSSVQPSPSTPAGSSTSEFSTSGASSEESEEEEGLEDLVAPPRIPIPEILAEHSSEESSSSEEENYTPKWRKKTNKKGNNILSKFKRHDFTQSFGPKVEINTDNVLSIFSNFFNTNLLDHIVSQSNLYATQKGHSLNLYKEELCCFLGLLIIMGFHQLPSMRLFWSTAPNFEVPRIAKAMTLRRFLMILRYLHLNDNSQMPERGSTNYDKLYKIRPFLNHFLIVFKNAFSPSRYLAIDESMIAFKGRSSLKQYMPLKPIKRGFKIWAICCSVTGYLLAFDFYSGKSEEKITSLGEKVVLHLSQAFEGLGYCLFFDRFFSTFPLIKKLLQKGFFACGTILQTRKYFPSSLLSKDKALKMGEMDFCFCNDYGLVKWKDRGTKCVCVVSSMDDPQATTTVTRKNKMGEKIPVQCPDSIASYNQYMGGVDVFDQYMSSYTTPWKSRRWWMKAFYYFLDASIVNAYILYKEKMKKENRQEKGQTKPLTHLMFRSKLANELIANFSGRKISRKPVTVTKKKFTSHPSLSVPPPSGHLPVSCKQRRCALCSTRKNRKRTTVQCDTCNVGLCLKTCFKAYHDSMI